MPAFVIRLHFIFSGYVDFDKLTLCISCFLRNVYLPPTADEIVNIRMIFRNKHVHCVLREKGVSKQNFGTGKLYRKRDFMREEGLFYC